MALENYLPDTNERKDAQAYIGDYSHEFANLLIVLDVMRCLLNEKVRYLEKDNGLDVLLEDQYKVVRLFKPNRIAQKGAELENEQQNQNRCLSFNQDAMTLRLLRQMEL